MRCGSGCHCANRVVDSECLLWRLQMIGDLIAVVLVTVLITFPAGVLVGQYLYQDVTLEVTDE